jgi:hypothetical protein
MPDDDALDEREADAAAGIFLATVQSLKDPEQLRVEFHVEPRAVVADVIDADLPGILAAHLDPRLFSGGAELQGIGQQVHPHLPQQCGIAAGRRQRFDFDLRLFSTDSIGA